jgi:hypothetical protein
MPDLPAEELRAMALAIDAGLEPRTDVTFDISAEGAQRLRDLLAGVATELGRQAGIEATWPLHRLLAALEPADG